MIIDIFLVICIIKSLSGHGKLIEPPSRNSMWRFGFNTPPDYNDNELFCGGRSHQWVINKGKCGVCGDAYELPRPRPHESGGKYGLGIVTRTYGKERINITIDLTANHRGYFVLKLCPSNNPHRDPEQTCFDKYPLKVSGTKSSKFQLKSSRTGMYHYSVQLPKGVTCKHCVLQWTYYTANNWGICPDNSTGLQCGDPEVFRNCADIKIKIGRTSNHVIAKRDNSMASANAGQRLDDGVSVNLIKQETCKGRNDRRFDDWCHNNCNHIPKFCPESHCVCSSEDHIGGENDIDDAPKDDENDIDHTPEDDENDIDDASEDDEKDIDDAPEDDENDIDDAGEDDEDDIDDAPEDDEDDENDIDNK